MQIIDNKDATILGSVLLSEPYETKQSVMAALLRGQQPPAFQFQPPAGMPPMVQPQAAPQQGGATGSWDAPTPTRQPVLRQAIAAQAQRGPVGPVAAPQIPPPPQGPQMDEFAVRDAALQKQHEAAIAEMNRATQPPDPAALNAMAEQRREHGGRQMLVALAAQHAGPSYEAVQRHYLQSAGEADRDVKMAGGTLTAQGYIQDPAHTQMMAVRQAEARVNAIERAQQANISAAERRRLEADKQQAAADLKQAQFSLQASIAEQASADRRFMAGLAHEDRQAATAAKGPGKNKAADEAAQAAADGRATLELLTQAEKHLKGATGSYIGKGLDEAGRVVGYATPGAKATAALQTIGGQLVARMPKMSGPQSDKDVLLYRQMAGQLDDPTIPYESKKAALDQIRVLNQKYAPLGGATGGWEPGASAAPAGGAVVDFNSLPKGR